MEGARRYSKAGRVDMLTVATRLWSFVVNNGLEEGGRRFESNSPLREVWKSSADINPHFRPQRRHFMSRRLGHIAYFVACSCR
jgi:hypothetical protein